MQKIKNNLGLIMMLVLSIIPVIFWISMKPVSSRFTSLGTTLTSLGQITGLVGMAMFSLVLILSGRLKFLEKYFGGLNRIYITHNLFGKLAFFFLLFHPLFLASRYLAFSLKDALLFLLPSSNWDINLGIFSFTILSILLYITIFANIKYDKWKLTHKFMGFSFFLGGLHSLLVPSDISRNVHLRWYMVTLTGLGILTYLYRVIFYQIAVKKEKYKVKNVKVLDDKYVSIEMEPEEKPIVFTPGQHIFVSFDDKNIGKEVHPFSISSSPENPNLEIVVKSLGDYTDKIKKLKPGTLAKIEGPFGMFWQNPNQNQIWVAGGIGITPFLSIARTLKDKETGDINLFYCVEDEKDAVFLEELMKIKETKNNFQVTPFYSKKQGYITADFIKTTSNGADDKEIFFCGPPAMMKSLKSQFAKLGVDDLKLHSEEFQLS